MSKPCEKATIYDCMECMGCSHAMSAWHDPESWGQDPEAPDDKKKQE